MRSHHILDLDRRRNLILEEIDWALTSYRARVVEQTEITKAYGAARTADECAALDAKSRLVDMSVEQKTAAVERKLTVARRLGVFRIAWDRYLAMSEEVDALMDAANEAIMRRMEQRRPR